MIQEEINEGNKIIGEFVGLEVTSIGNNEYKYITKKLSPWKVATVKPGKFQENYLESADFWTDIIKFHSDWNWLIPVYSKIMQSCFDDKSTNYNENYYNLIDSFDVCTHDDRIDSAFYAVVEFLKWYNETNNNTDSI